MTAQTLSLQDSEIENYHQNIIDITFSSWQMSKILSRLLGSICVSTNPWRTRFGLTRHRWWMVPIFVESFNIIGNMVEDTSYWRRLYAVCEETNESLFIWKIATNYWQLWLLKSNNEQIITQKQKPTFIWPIPTSKTSGQWVRGCSSISRTELAWPLSASWHKTSKRSRQNHAWFPCFFIRYAESANVWENSLDINCLKDYVFSEIKKKKGEPKKKKYQLSWTMRKCKYIRWCSHSIFKKR